MDNKQVAENIFNGLCAYLDGIGWSYDTDINGDAFVVHFSVNGDDIPMKLIISVNHKSELLSVFSHMPYDVPKEQRVAVGMAMNLINYSLADGSFDFSLTSGKALFRLTQSIRGMTSLPDEIYAYLVHYTTYIADKYNDKLLMVMKGAMSIEELNDFIENE